MIKALPEMSPSGDEERIAGGGMNFLCVSGKKVLRNKPMTIAPATVREISFDHFRLVRNVTILVIRIYSLSRNDNRPVASLS